MGEPCLDLRDQFSNGGGLNQVVVHVVSYGFERSLEIWIPSQDQGKAFWMRSPHRADHKVDIDEAEKRARGERRRE
jgi:hypothetical protein